MSQTTIQKEVAKLNEELRAFVETQSRTFQTTQRQSQLIEESCCNDWSAEIAGFKIHKSGGKSPIAKKTFYQNAEHAKKIIDRGCRLTRECDANRDCLNKRINLTIGSNITYKLEVKPPLREDYEQVKSRLADVRKRIEVALCDINDQGSFFRQTERETVRRYLRDGNKLCICDPDEANEHGVIFIEPCDVRQPDVDNPEDSDNNSIYDVELWEFGIVALASNRKRKLGYWVYGMSGVEGIDNQSELSDVETDPEFGYILAADMMHLKNRVDIDDPVGVPQAEGTEDWSRALKLLTMKAADSMNCQFDYTVIRTIAEHASTTEHRTKSLLEYASGKKGDSGDRADDGPGEYTLKNESIELNAPASLDGALNLIGRLTERVAGAWGMPGFLATGDAGSGNRANFDAMLKSLFALLNSDRGMFAGVWSRIVEKVLRRFLTTSEANEIFEYLRIVVSFDMLTVDSALEICQVDAMKIQNGTMSPQDAIRRDNRDPDLVCAEIAAFRNKQNDQAAALDIDDTTDDPEETDVDDPDVNTDSVNVE